MQEEKSIGVMNNPQMQIRQDSRRENRPQTSPLKDSNKIENILARWRGSMQEYKFAEVMDKNKRQIRRDSKSGSPIRTSQSKGSGND
jgi:hypothetical protein